MLTCPDQTVRTAGSSLTTWTPVYDTKRQVRDYFLPTHSR
jgi:hypothetical protein